MIVAENLSRLGTETAFDVLARAQKLAAQGKNIINLSIGQPDFKTPEHIVEAAIKAMKDGHHGYTAANGILALREAVAADLYRRHGTEINPDHVVIMPGGKPTLYFAISMFGEAGAEIMYPNPGFPIYQSMIKYSGAKAVPIALKEKNSFAFSADDILSAITPRTRLIILNSPANPTGGVAQKEEIDKLVSGLAKFPNVAILSDEIYSSMLYDGKEHVSLLHYPEIRDRLIVLDGWSKTYAMTGWRLGYAVWPQPLIEHITRLCINMHSCVNAPTQFAGIAALEGPQDPVHEMMKAFDERRHIIVEKLNTIPQIKCIMPQGAFYAFPNITGTKMTSEKIQNLFLEEAGVATISGTSFGEFGEGFLRFSYANSTENILEAISRIEKILSR